MKEKIGTIKGRGRSKGEIKGEQCKPHLAYVEQRQNRDFEQECEQEKRKAK